MKRRWMIALATAILAFVFAAVLWPRQREPEYKGKKLSEWLDIYQERLGLGLTYGTGNPANITGYEEVRQIGTNGLPWLMRWMDCDRVTGSKLQWVIVRLPQAVQRTRIVSSIAVEPFLRFGAAENGFQILGPQAAPAIPELIRLMNRRTSQTSSGAVSALFAIGEPAQAALLAGLSNPHADRLSIVQVATLIKYQGTNSPLWAKALDRCAQDGDSVLALCSVQALESMGEEAVTVSEWVNGNITARFTNYPAKVNVLPGLLRATQHRDEIVRSAATNALIKIAPEVLTNGAANHF